MDLSALGSMPQISVEQWISLGVPIAVAIFGVFQWLLAERRRRRQRDVELIHWGNEAIRCFAQIEDLCDRWSPDGDGTEARHRAVDASTLVDQGRLFFPNVPMRSQGGSHRSGKRPAILDALLRAYYVARLGTSEPSVDLGQFRDVLRQARVDFIFLLQREMGKSLRQTPRDRAGQTLDPDPRTW